MTGALDVDLWVWSLDLDDATLAPLAALLDPDEQAKAARFVHERHRRRYAAGRGRLRQILGRRLGVAPADVAFVYGDHGKPALARPPEEGLAFNLSHTEDLAALAVARGDVLLGVDVEIARPVEEDVAGRFFSAPEQADLAALPDADRTRGFHRCWTRKEAIVKALGDGLSAPLDGFAVTLDPAAPRLAWFRGEPEAADRWALAHFEPRSDVIGAIAALTEGRALQVTLRSWQEN